MDEAEYELQRDGLARALVAPEVQRAFLAGDPVSLFIFEWSGPANQMPMLPGWQAIRSDKDLVGAAASITAHPRRGHGDPHPTTGLGEAILHAGSALRDRPACRARTLDVSGDGVSNDGSGPREAFERAPFDGVTVSALVIGGAWRSGGLPEDEAELLAWFEAEVLHGPDGVLVVANDYEDDERVIGAKLMRELELPLVSGSPLEGGT